MYKPKSAIIALVFIFITAFKADNLPPLFANRLLRAQASFTQPTDYTPTALVKNGQMNYDYALKSPGKTLEVRYTIRPLDSLMIQYHDMQKQGNGLNISPENFYKTSFMAIMMNISGGNGMSKINDFPPESVKKEFNADWGATSYCTPAGQFGEGYKYCMAVAIHKDHIADAYYFYLSNNANDFQTLLPPIFYAVKFK